MISDEEFVSGIAFLMDTGVIAIGPAAEDAPPAGGPSADAQQVPGWVRTSAGWRADGMISDSEFVRGIEFLVSEGIIRTGR